MKKMLCWLFPLCLLLTACSVSPWRTAQTRFVEFYFAASGSESYASETGALYAERRELAAEDVTVSGLLAAYWAGPRSQQASPAIPSQLELLDWSLEEGLLTLLVTNHWQELTPLQTHVAEASLLMTMTQLENVQRLCIQTEQDVATGAATRILSPKDYLLADRSGEEALVAVKLYFPDDSGQYLRQETRYRPEDEVGTLEEYIVKALLAGSEEPDAASALPERTNLLGVELSQGCCTVNFSEAFVTNCPKTHLQARLAVFSVVNSLTELAEVEQVKLLCVGREITDYHGLDLSRALVREELAIEPEKPATSDLQINICIPCGGSHLVAIPMTVRQTGGRSGVEAVINALLSFEPANGYENPIPEGTALVNQSVQNGLCTVTFNNTFAQPENPEQQLLAVRAVAATLCSLPQIDRVIVQVSDINLTAAPLGQELTPSPGWFLP